MHSRGENAVVIEGSTLQKAVVEMSSKELSMVTVVDDEHQLKGIITEGNLRRLLEKEVDVYYIVVDDMMTKKPKRIKWRLMLCSR